MRQLNLNELTNKIVDYSSKTQYADKNQYLQNLTQLWNFIKSQDKSNSILSKIEKDFNELNIQLQNPNLKRQDKLQLLITYEHQGAFGYFEIRKLLSDTNIQLYEMYNVANGWYGNRRSMDDAKDVFNDNFLIPFIELLIWYLEESQSTDANDYFSKKEVKIFEEKLNQIRDLLITVQDGQEIIFNDIEDLREQLLSVKKKNWFEMFKGKFYDFVFQKAITETVFVEIFNILTGRETTALGDYIRSIS